MQIREKIDTLCAQHDIAELSHLFDRATVTISWRGERLVSVGGYEGSANMQETISKYMRSAQHLKKIDPSNGGGPVYWGIWGRINKLFDASNTELKKTYLYCYLVPLRELYFEQSIFS